MKKILAIAGSNSKKSINKILATYIANKIENVEVKILDWDEIELPLYSPDLEAESGIPENAIKFNQFIQDTDAIVLSLAEHNGLHTAAFKNLWDWTSRVTMKFWNEKPLFLAATSPGQRGGAGVLKVTKEILPFFGGNLITDFSLPSFNNNFQKGKIIDEELENELIQKTQEFQKSIS